jgi:hypothetical protein
VTRFGFRKGQGQQSENSAFALVVGSEHVDQVFHGHDQQQGPEDERYHPQNIASTHWRSMTRSEAFFEGVNRAGADVSIDDAQRGH